MLIEQLKAGISVDAVVNTSKEISSDINIESVRFLALLYAAQEKETLDPLAPLHDGNTDAAGTATKIGGDDDDTVSKQEEDDDEAQFDMPSVSVIDGPISKPVAVPSVFVSPLPLVPQRLVSSGCLPFFPVLNAYIPA